MGSPYDPLWRVEQLEQRVSTLESRITDELIPLLKEASSLIESLEKKVG